MSLTKPSAHHGFRPRHGKAADDIRKPVLNSIDGVDDLGSTRLVSKRSSTYLAGKADANEGGLPDDSIRYTTLPSLSSSPQHLYYLSR